MIDPTFWVLLLAAVRNALRLAPCPECHMDTTGGGLHGVSHVHVGELCHLGMLLTIADREAL